MPWPTARLSTGGDELWGSVFGATELAVIRSIDLHARCEFAPYPGCPLDLTFGTAEVQCFNERSMQYDGPTLHAVPLYMVHGLHFSAALAEARAAAISVACRLEFGALDALDEFDALDAFSVRMQGVLRCDGAGALASLLASWGHAHEAQQVATLQSEANRDACMWAMLLEQAGLTDLGADRDDFSCDPSFHFEHGLACGQTRWSMLHRYWPLLSDFLCGERPTWPIQDTRLAQQGGGAGGPEDVHRTVSVPNLFTAPQEDYADDEVLITYDPNNDGLDTRHVANAWGYYC